MLAKLLTFSLLGIDAKPVDVEVDISPAAMPRTSLVGLAEAAVKESIHRIERALANSGYQRPGDRIVINLSPADLPKEAASFDLPIALGLLAASGQFASDLFAQYAVIGETGLDGNVRPVKGALSMALGARDRGLKGIVVPVENANEPALTRKPLSVKTPLASASGPESSYSSFCVSTVCSTDIIQCSPAKDRHENDQPDNDCKCDKTAAIVIRRRLCGLARAFWTRHATRLA